MNFTTRITDPINIDIDGLDTLFPHLADADYREIKDSFFVVKWAAEIEAREWGIKSIDFSVVSVIGSFDVQAYDADGLECGWDEIKDFNFSDFAKEIDLEPNRWFGFSVEGIEIDFTARAISVR